MSKTRHRLLAIMALLLAMLTVMPSAMADMRGINVSGRAVSERHVHRRLRLRRRQGHAGHRLHQRVHDQPGQLRAAAGQEPRLLPLPGGGNATAEADYFVYTSAAYLYQIPADVRSHCGLWVAQYANNNATGYQTRPWNYGRYGEAMRQYTSNGRIPGHAGPLDLNYFRGTTAQWNKYANPNGGSSTPTPTPQPSVAATRYPASPPARDCGRCPRGACLPAT